jgi:uncharacterized membrane protein YeaQ/YmgE (transglycosylase-associated protein family)
MRFRYATQQETTTMGLGHFLILLIIAGICGSLAQALVGYSRGGCLVSVVIGFIGALLGTWLAGKLGLPELLALNIGGSSFPIVWTIIGASLFVAVLSLLSGRRRYW